MPDFSPATNADRELGLIRIAEIREQHNLMPSPERVRRERERDAADEEPPVPQAAPVHDPATCRHCLGLECFWCMDAGKPVEGCPHTLSQRHGAPLGRHEPEPEPEPELTEEPAEELTEELTEEPSTETVLYGPDAFTGDDALAGDAEESPL